MDFCWKSEANSAYYVGNIKKVIQIFLLFFTNMVLSLQLWLYFVEIGDSKKRNSNLLAVW